jgi:hypothetical protein
MATLGNFSDFELPPEGRHVGVLVGFIDLGLQTGQFGSSRQANLTFELVDHGTPVKPVLAFKRIFNLSTRSKKFLPVVRALTGLHDIRDVDTRDLLGKACELEIEHVTNDDGNVFANIECKPLKGPRREFNPVSEFRFLSLQPDDFSQADLDKLPERQRDRIMQSETYRTLMATRAHVAASGGKPVAELIDDEIPF